MKIPTVSQRLKSITLPFLPIFFTILNLSRCVVSPIMFDEYFTRPTHRLRHSLDSLTKLNDMNKITKLLFYRIKFICSQRVDKVIFTSIFSPLCIWEFVMCLQRFYQQYFISKCSFCTSFQINAGIFGFIEYTLNNKFTHTQLQVLFSCQSEIEKVVWLCKVVYMSTDWERESERVAIFSVIIIFFFSSSFEIEFLMLNSISKWNTAMW